MKDYNRRRPLLLLNNNVKAELCFINGLKYLRDEKLEKPINHLDKISTHIIPKELLSKVLRKKIKTIVSTILREFTDYEASELGLWCAGSNELRNKRILLNQDINIQDFFYYILPAQEIDINLQDINFNFGHSLPKIERMSMLDFYIKYNNYISRKYQEKNKS